MFASRRGALRPGRCRLLSTCLAGLFLMMWAMAKAPAVHAVVQPLTMLASKTVHNAANNGNYTVGSTVTYVVTIFQQGPGTQPNNPGHEFTDTLPPQVTLTSATAINTNTNVAVGTISNSGNTVNWDATIPPGNYTITITATINPGTQGQTASNQGTLNYAADGGSVNNTAVLTDSDLNSPGITPATFFIQPDTVSQAGPNYVVNTTLDHDDTICGPNDCSLRDAIVALNNRNPAPAASSISFNIPAGQASGGVFTIQLASGLSSIGGNSGTNGFINNFTIDGNTEATFLGIPTSTHPIVVLSGAGGGNMILLQNVGNGTVKNLAFSQLSGTAVSIQGTNTATNDSVQGCYIGTDATGSTKSSSGAFSTGISINSASGNTIGGTTPATRNLISGTSTAFGVTGNNNTIQGNYVGTDATGSYAIPNTNNSNGQGTVMFLTGNGNLISGNLISGNTAGGLLIQGNNNTLQGNLIGTDASGTGAIPNFFSGTFAPAAIGVGGNNNTVGGTTPGAGNVIANGSSAAIVVSNGTSNVLRGNSIYNNSGLGIDLSSSGTGGDGVTVNDAGDSDSGPNNLQNFPVLTAATAPTSGSVTVSGTLNSTPSTPNFSIDFYANVVVHPSGSGEGRYYLGSTTVNTDLNGNASFTNVALSGVPSNARFITATATDANGNTSEFSADIAFGFANAKADTATTAEDTPVDINVLSNDAGTGTLAVTAVTQGTNGAVTINPNGTVHYVPAANFNGTDTFTYTINNGAGSTSTATVTVTVTPVNDAPVNTVPGPQSVNEDASLVFSGVANNALSIADVDSGSNPLQVSLSVNQGTLSLSGTTGLTFSLGTGTANAGLTFQGTIAAINAALAGLTYTPPVNFSGPVTLSMSTNDLGNTGAGGPLTANSTIAITVVPDNDPPVAANDSYAVTSSSLSVLAPGVLGNDTDIDSPTLTASLVTNPTHGSLTLNADGSFTYTPVIGYNGPDSFSYKATDGVSNSNLATVTLTVSGNISQTVTLTLANNSVAEGQSVFGLLTLSRSSAVAVTVNLVSSQTGATPTTITIPAGQTSAFFSLKTLSNPLATGPQTVTITANAGAYGTATASLTITDNEVPTLTLTVAPTSISENYGPVAALGTVTRNTPTTQPLTVALSSNSKAAKVPASVVIPAGASAATFVIAAVDNRIVNQPQTAQLKAHSTNYQDGLATLTVTDNGKVTQDLRLTLAGGTTFTEQLKGQTVTGMVSLSGKPLTKDLLITLVSSDPKRVALPASVLLKAGQSSATFTFRILDNTVADGPHSVWLVARAAGFGTSALLVTVQDNDGPILSLTLSNTTAAATVTKLTGTLTRLHVPTTTALVVTLSSSDKTRVTVPPTVTIPAGKAAATFTVTIKHSTLATATHIVTITASKAGLVSGSATLTVQDVAKPVITPHSTVGLSTANANAATNSISLRFLAALDADSASDAANYTVTVNGQSVTPESAGYNAMTHSVTLGLPEGSLHAGDKVMVQWSDLLDTYGAIVSGQSGVVEAR